MAYVRSVSYTFPYNAINRLQNGTDLWMRLVPAQKLIAQESNGMLDTGVWITQNGDGSLRVFTNTERYTLEDLQSFAEDPDIVHHEHALAEAAVAGSRVVDVYETLG
jgi:hypothetical protein